MSKVSLFADVELERLLEVRLASCCQKEDSKDFEEKHAPSAKRHNGP